MNVTLRQLRVFTSAARHLSFARAAEELHLSPPAVSMQMKELESEVGLPLFDREGRRLTLSTAGEYFLVHAKRLLSALKDKKIDAAFADALQLSFWTQSPAAGNCCMLFDGPYLSERFLGEGMTIMLGPQGGTLAAALDSALAALSRDGRLEEIYLRYFPSGLY